MELLRIKRIKSASLVETIISLTLIVFVFGLSTTVFARLISANISDNDLIAESVLEGFRIETNHDRNFFDSETNVGGFIIRRSVMGYRSNLLLIHYRVYKNNEEMLLERREIVKDKDTDEEN